MQIMETDQQPSAAVGQTSSATGEKQVVLDLIAQREKLEDEIKELMQVLAANNTNMTDGLVDAEGYPLPDIDIYSVRHARHDIICKQNDIKQLTEQIERGLHVLHSDATDTSAGSASSNSGAPQFRRTSNKPFARIASVAPLSPAQTAGLKADDRLIHFYDVDANTFTQLKQIADIVGKQENHPINLTVVRDGHAVHLTLTPAKWAGNGLLGCQIVAVDEKERK